MNATIKIDTFLMVNIFLAKLITLILSSIKRNTLKKMSSSKIPKILKAVSLDKNAKKVSAKNNKTYHHFLCSINLK